MGLDVYVGPMERFYSRQWETVVEKYAHSIGFTVEFRFEEGRTFLTPEEVGPAVRSWREDLNAKLNDADPEAGYRLSWPEGLDLPYWTEKPDWAGYDGLRCWTAYAIFDKHHRKRKKRRFDGASKVFGRVDAEIEAGELTSEYLHFLWHRDILLPGDHTSTITIKDVDGKTRFIGWIGPFIRCLDACNEMTWNAPPEEVALWRKGEFGFSKKHGLENCAKYGYAVFSEAAQMAVKLGQPLMLDY